MRVEPLSPTRHLPSVAYNIVVVCVSIAGGDSHGGPGAGPDGPAGAGRPAVQQPGHRAAGPAAATHRGQSQSCGGYSGPTGVTPVLQMSVTVLQRSVTVLKRSVIAIQRSVGVLQRSVTVL